MTALASALLLVTALAAADGSTVAPTLSLSAPGGMVISMTPDRPSEASGGWKLRYEEVRIEGDHMVYRLSPFAGSAKPVLEKADLAGGPAGPADGRVLFDSSASTLPQVAFRGVMRPRTVAIRRQEADAPKPTEVRFRAELGELGDFHGLILTDQGDCQYIVWADRAVLEYVAPLAADAALGMGTPRLTVIYLYGRPSGDGDAGRAAEVLRMVKPVPDAEATVDIQEKAKAYAMLAAGRAFSIYFDELGKIQSIEGMDRFEGDDLVPRKAQAQLKVGPAPGK